MAHFILADTKIFCPYCENEVTNEGLRLINYKSFMHECGELVENPLPRSESRLLLRLEGIGMEFGIDEETLQDYVNKLHKALKTLDTEPVKSIGHEEYNEREGYEETDPLKMAKDRKKLFLSQFRG